MVLQEKKTLYKAYCLLEKQVRDYGLIAGPFTRINKSRNKRGTEFMLIEKGSQLPKELHAAKKKIEFEAGECLLQYGLTSRPCLGVTSQMLSS